MIITSLEIFGFGKFHQFSLHFSDKYNVIYGENEAGKSTLHSFIRAMLFGVPSIPSRKEQFFRYRHFLSRFRAQNIVSRVIFCVIPFLCRRTGLKKI